MDAAIVKVQISKLANVLVAWGVASGLNYYQGKAAFRVAMFLMDEIDAGRDTDEYALAHRATEFIDQELSQMSSEQRGY